MNNSNISRTYNNLRLWNLNQDVAATIVGVVGTRPHFRPSALGNRRVVRVTPEKQLRRALMTLPDKQHRRLELRRFNSHV